MHASKADLPAMVIGEYEGRTVDWGDFRVAFETMPEQFPPDESPFAGLPDDRCQCPHWGYLIKGSFRVPTEASRTRSSTPARPTTCARATSSRRSSRSSWSSSAPSTSTTRRWPSSRATWACRRSCNARAWGVTTRHALVHEPAHRHGGRLRGAAGARPLPAPAAAVSGARDRGRDRRRAVRARLGRGRRGGRGGRAARPRVRALPGRARDRVREAARARAAPHAARLRDLVHGRAGRLARAERGGPGRHPAAGGDHPLLDVARRARAGAQGLRAARHQLRAADHRRGVDRRLRRDHPALDLLLRRGRDRLDAAAARRAVRARRHRLLRRQGRGALAPPARGPAAAAGHDRADPHPRVARPAASASPRSPRRWGSR